MNSSLSPSGNHAAKLNHRGNPDAFSLVLAGALAGAGVVRAGTVGIAGTGVLVEVCTGLGDGVVV